MTKYILFLHQSSVMRLFTRRGKTLSPIQERQFKKEIDIQKITEENLTTLFGLDFIASEFSLNNLRIDTLAYNPETNAFTVIEYKKTQNYSLIDQGYAYLSLLLNNQADFILEYNQLKNKHLGKKDIDWSQSRVIFISPQYTKYQIQATNFQNLPFELWEIHQFENNLILYEQVETSPQAASITPIVQADPATKQVTNTIKVYTEETHLNKTSSELQEVYWELKERISALGSDIESKPNKLYMVFKAQKNIVAVIFQRSQLKLVLASPKGTLTDPYGHTRDISNVGHWAPGDYEVTVNTKTELDEIMPLIRQTYQQSHKI